MNKSKKKYGFNIIDVLIILLVIAIGVVLYYYMSARNTLASNLEVDVEYVVELKVVDAEFTDNFNIGDKVVETVRDQQIGEIVNVEVTPAYNVATNTDTGEMFISYYPQIESDTEGNTEGTEEPKYEFYNIKVTVRDTFKRSDKGYKKNAFNLVTGQLVYFRIPGYIGEGFCIATNEINEEETV